MLRIMLECRQRIIQTATHFIMKLAWLWDKWNRTCRRVANTGTISWCPVTEAGVRDSYEDRTPDRAEWLDYRCFNFYILHLNLNILVFNCILHIDARMLTIIQWTNFNYNPMNILTFYCTMYVLSMYVFLCMVVFIFYVLCQKWQK